MEVVWRRRSGRGRRKPRYDGPDDTPGAVCYRVCLYTTNPPPRPPWMSSSTGKRVPVLRPCRISRRAHAPYSAGVTYVISHCMIKNRKKPPCLRSNHPRRDVVRTRHVTISHSFGIFVSRLRRFYPDENALSVLPRTR